MYTALARQNAQKASKFDVYETKEPRISKGTDTQIFEAEREFDGFSDSPGSNRKDTETVTQRPRRVSVTLAFGFKVLGYVAGK